MPLRLPHKAMRLLAVATVAAVIAIGVDSCRIEPPLRLPEETLRVEMAQVETTIEAVWEVDASWRSEWWYGWDERDEQLFGPIDYPEPLGYEVRIYPLGDNPAADYTQMHRISLQGNFFRRRFEFGYHDMLAWSHIDTPDQTQSVIFDESDIRAITATASRTNLSYAVDRSRSTCNNPDIFYGALEQAFYISSNPEDYDYYDAENNIWVKRLQTRLTPLVYIYLVQVVIYNNAPNRFTGVTDRGAMSALSEGVTLHTGHTFHNDINVAFDMRYKSDLTGPEGRTVDVVGGKLTTFGLCDMDSWARTHARGGKYTVARADLDNNLSVSLRFANATERTYVFDVTRQLQAHPHGGVVTVEIDADTVQIPATPGGDSSSFRPTVDEYSDSIVHEFPF